MNDGGYNVALFDLNAADLTVCHLFTIKKVSYERDETTNPWFVHDGRYVTNVITDIRPIGAVASGDDKPGETDSATGVTSPVD